MVASGVEGLLVVLKSLIFGAQIGQQISFHKWPSRVGGFDLLLGIPGCFLPSLVLVLGVDWTSSGRGAGSFLPQPAVPIIPMCTETPPVSLTVRYWDSSFGDGLLLRLPDRVIFTLAALPPPA